MLIRKIEHFITVNEKGEKKWKIPPTNTPKYKK